MSKSNEQEPKKAVNEAGGDGAALREALEMVQALSKDVAELRARQDQSEMRIAVDGAVQVSDADVDDFLAETAREDVIWSENPYFAYLLQVDEEVYDEHLKKARKLSPSWAHFGQYWGPGVELRDAAGRKLFPKGIGRYELPEIEDTGTRAVLLFRIQDRTNPNHLPRVYSDLEWRERLRMEYEQRRATEAIRKRTAARIAAMQSGKVEGDPKAG
jgi:hypothetical protein